jgi:hypothetical protein
MCYEHETGKKLKAMTNLTPTTDTKKLKINTTVQVYDTVELDIDLPYFCKTPDDVYFKIVSDTEAVRLWADTGCIMICNPQNSHNAREIAKATVVEEIEFQLAYSNAITHLDKLVSK